MEEQQTLTANDPEAVTDQALKEDSSYQAPSVDTEQGVSSAVAEADIIDENSNGSDEVATGLTQDMTEDSNESVVEPLAASTENLDESTENPDESVAGFLETSSGAANIEGSATEALETASKSSEVLENELPSEIGTPYENVSDQVTSLKQDSSMTMEEALAASDEQLGQKPIHRGMMIKGNIIMLAQNGIVVDVGAKIEGVIPYNQLFEQDLTPEDAARYFKSGDEVQVFVIRADIPNNVIILSKKRADQERAWNLLQHIYEEKKPVEVEIIEQVRGGLVANLGVRAFLPASQVDVRRISDLTPYVGQRVKVRIIELNRRRNRIIISRRSIVEEEVSEKKSETLQKLEPGLVLEGEVVKITDFGVFINLGGVDGLVHRSEVSYQRFGHPKEVLSIGDKVKVEVLDMDLEHERINLSMKKLMSDPWESVLDKYTLGQKVSGNITNLTPFGAFVEVEPGLEGLIHVSEMSWTKRVRHPKEVLQEGDFVEAMVLKIDLNDKRLSLGLRQTKPDPWSSLPDNYPPGTEITGPITGITDFGVFIEIEDGIEGLVHVSELDHQRVDNIKEEFKKGDEITAVILNIDPVEQRASLSRKRLIPYTPSETGETPQPKEKERKGSRKGRRGGRRSQGIDYDYSYASSDNSGKSTTKLGDVYADLFAQFGLTDTQSVPPPAISSVEVEEKAEAEGKDEGSDSENELTKTEAINEVDESLTQETSEISQVLSETAEGSSEVVAQVLDDVKAEVETTSESSESSTGVDLESSTKVEESQETASEIDAIEAAAMLTAAFREGKRPLDLDSSQEEEESNDEIKVDAAPEKDTLTEET